LPNAGLAIEDVGDHKVESDDDRLILFKKRLTINIELY